ncbi:hypothetical protein JW877_10235, partial [bacterium]|nr:hypothetical protein [bacterium]
DQFEYQFKDLRHSFDYYVTGGDFESPVYTVTVIDNPRIIDLKLSYQYPGYTGLGTQVIEQNDGNIDALYGTRVQIEALANKKISEARMVFSDSTIQVMTINDNKLSTSFMISTEGSYHLECQDFAGNSNSDPIEYQIRVQLDDSPIVQIIKPGEDIDLTEEMLVPLGVLGEDDFGFSRFDLVFTKKGSADTSLKKLEFNDNRKSKVFLELVWSLAELDLLPEDIVTYWIVGYDNDQLRGPKAGESRHFSVRFPSLEEILQEVAQEQQKQEEDVEEVFEEGKRLQEQLEKISRELMKEKELNWEGKKELEKMLKDQEDMVKKLDQISQDMEMTLEKIQKNQLVTMEIFDKMQQIQEILDEIATPEMREAMQQLQEALQNMDPKALEEAMKNFQMNQEKMLEQLEQTLALLKRMQIEQRLSELIKLAMNQENTQQEINEALENMAPEDMPNLSNQQQQVSQACQFMEQELQKLADMMKEFQDMPGEMADSMAEKTKADSLPKLANQASSQMSQCNSKGCKKSGEQLQEDLTELRENLQKLQNEMNMMLREEVVEAIRKAIYDLIYLSNRQEGYYDTTLVSGVQEEVVVDLLEKQVVLKENLDGIADRVFDIGTKTFFLSPQVGVAIGEALIQVNQALETLSMRQSQRSLNFQQEAMTQMNMAALVLMNAMNQLSQSSSCSGAEKFFEMMQSMCQQQCGVNQQTIPMAGPKPGGSQPGGMDPSQQASAARLAAEQEEIKKNLEDLEREYGEYRNILGRFDETVQDMERVIEDLASSNVDHHTLERQERILSRMLDAQKSLHQRNYTQKRQSETGEDIVRRSPSGLPDDLGEDQNTIQQALIRALNQSYPRVYENMIRDYFKALGENLQSQSIEKTE